MVAHPCARFRQEFIPWWPPTHSWSLVGACGGCGISSRWEVLLGQSGLGGYTKVFSTISPASARCMGCFAWVEVDETNSVTYPDHSIQVGLHASMCLGKRLVRIRCSSKKVVGRSNGLLVGLCVSSPSWWAFGATSRWHQSAGNWRSWMGGVGCCDYHLTTKNSACMAWTVRGMYRPFFGTMAFLVVVWCFWWTSPLQYFPISLE